MYLIDFYAVLPSKGAIILNSILGGHREPVNEEIRMTLKNKFQLVAMATLLSFAGTALAGKQGISFYGGLALAGVASQQKTPQEFDPAPAGGAFIGIEEDGWSLEYYGIRTLKTGTSAANVEYTGTGNITSLGYRTLETRGGLYFLLSLGIGSMDVEYTPATTINHTDGKVYTLGVGMRLDKTERLELNYSLYSSNPVDELAGDTSIDNVHLVSLRYIWGGTPYDPRF